MDHMKYREYEYSTSSKNNNSGGCLYAILSGLGPFSGKVSAKESWHLLGDRFTPT